MDAIPFRPADDWVALLAPVLVVLAALVVLAFVARRDWPAGALQAVRKDARRRLRLVERIAIARGASLVVVEFDGREILVGVCAGQVSIIDRSTPRPGGTDAP